MKTKPDVLTKIFHLILTNTANIAAETGNINKATACAKAEILRIPLKKSDADYSRLLRFAEFMGVDL